MTARTCLAFVLGAVMTANPACMDMGHVGTHAHLPPAPQMLTLPRADASLGLPSLVDVNPDPRVVEVSLRAMMAEVEYLPGKPVQAWTYDGRVPGPALRANVGDRVIVHFTNQLPESTTIHWHGVRVPNAMDGVAAVMAPITPGTSFTYDFVVPDAGTFWFHPHVRSDVQVEKGLYAPLVVEDPIGPALAATESVVMLDDVLLDPQSGQPIEQSHDPRAEMMGREGNLVLVNGPPANVRLMPASDQPHRLRVVNAATARFFRLGVVNGTMLEVAGDGGLLERPREISERLLVPGERTEIVVSPKEAGGEVTVRALPYERASGAGATTSVDLVHLPFAVPSTPWSPLPAVLRAPLPPLVAPTMTWRLRLGEQMSHGGWRFTFNGQAYPAVTALDAGKGGSAIWDVVNETERDHPLHLHGFFFRAPSGERKDTINIPAEATVRLIVEFDGRAGATGRWMYHCHILEHAERGMMGEVLVR